MVKPGFVLIAVASLDGRIARDSGHPTSWSSAEDKAFMCSLIAKCDAVVVGNNTYKVAKQQLSKRNCIVFTRSVKAMVQNGSRLAFVNPGKVGIANFCAEHGYVKVAVLGGTGTYSYFLDNGLVGDIFLTVEPIVFGCGLCLFDSRFMVKKFRLVSMKRLNRKGSVVLHYSAAKRSAK